jgi:hypothetical protein
VRWARSGAVADNDWAAGDVPVLQRLGHGAVCRGVEAARVTDPKPGYKSTEALAVLAALGHVSALFARELVSWQHVTLAALSVALALGYTWARTVAKRPSNDRASSE